MFNTKEQHTSQEETRQNIISDMVKKRNSIVPDFANASMMERGYYGFTFCPSYISFILCNNEEDSLCILGRAKRSLDLWSLVPKESQKSRARRRFEDYAEIYADNGHMYIEL